MKLPTWIGGRRPILMSTRPPPFDANLSGDMISINGWQATGGSSRELSPEEEMLIIHSTSMAAEPLTNVGDTFCLINRREKEVVRWGCYFGIQETQSFHCLRNFCGYTSWCRLLSLVWRKLQEFVMHLPWFRDIAGQETFGGLHDGY
ncbi:uncharacterized protein LOC111894908 isoform X1 [Lactuca sativa]|nr:uncharacterized protein LOC111894908 isoform X1 [Lactuca sativa]XP_042756772.1 uncharacterized protein LOC111894908 isoform X1 [Lactuca sativa]